MKTFEGEVISVKMQKTAVVEITRRTPHPLYKKLLRKSKSYKVDTGEFNPNLGDLVRIIETKPVSKDKYFKVVEILNKKEEMLPQSKKIKIVKPRKLKENVK